MSSRGLSVPHLTTKNFWNNLYGHMMEGSYRKYLRLVLITIYGGKKTTTEKWRIVAGIWSKCSSTLYQLISFRWIESNMSHQKWREFENITGILTGMHTPISAITVFPLRLCVFSLQVSGHNQANMVQIQAKRKDICGGCLCRSLGDSSSFDNVYTSRCWCMARR